MSSLLRRMQPWLADCPMLAVSATLTIVVEAATRSGSLITADLATDIGHTITPFPARSPPAPPPAPTSSSTPARP